MCVNVLTNGIWAFSKAQKVARDFLRDYYTMGLKDAFVASQGYNFPVINAPFSRPPMPVYDQDPEFAVIPKLSPFATAIGYPGPTTAAAEAVWNQWVLNDMFAKVARGTSIDEAVTWAEGEIKRMYGQYSRS